MSKVYFIKPVGLDGPIKIGCSVAPDSRRSTLETWSPFALEIVAEIEGGFALEARFHALFQETHQRREWFGTSRRLQAVIAAINAGTFNVETLPAPIYIAKQKERGGKRPLSPARKFSCAYTMRVRTLVRRGMKWADYIKDGPRFCHTFVEPNRYTNIDMTPDDLPALIRACEAYADKITAQFGHDGMKPVRWQGPLPAKAAESVAA